jgi:primary-amine oxidase
MFNKEKLASRPRLIFGVATFFTIAYLGSPIVAADHPLQPLSAKEIRDSASVVSRYFAVHQLPTDRILYPIIVLKEPPKETVLGYLDHGGPPPSRQSKIEVMHYPTNRLWVATVDLASGNVVGLSLQSAGTQSSVTATEFVNADTVVHANATWKAAVIARGLDPDKCYLDVWAPGDVPGPAGLMFGSNGRFLRVVTYYRGATKVTKTPPQNPYDRPVEGLVVSVDMNAETMILGTPIQGKVVEILDTGIRPTSSTSGNADQTRPALNPLVISEPGGSNYVRTLADGRQFHWQNWDFYVALHPREGLVLYDVRFAGRRIAYRAALSEVYVPYGIGDSNWLWRSAFDIGEYLMGTLAQKLERDQDVPGNAQFLNATLANDTGSSYSYPSSIGVYERFDGFAWTRTDPSTGGRDTRGARALVLHWNTWIGNYIYGFDWTFRQDGSLEVVVGATGTTVNRATTTAAGEGSVDDAAPLVGVAPIVPGSAAAGGGGMAYVRAPNHQHFLNFRFDFDVDGIDNVATTKDIVHVPAAAGGGDNVFEATETAIASEGAVSADPTRTRSWEIRSAVATNSLGEPTAYAVELPYLAFPLSEPDYPPLLRAQFAAQQFWVTRYQDGELYAAGDHPNQGREGEGLATFIGDSDPLHATTTGVDIVTWFTIGFTHSPRAEDYPVMSTERISFKISPHGFFGSNPTLDLAK